MVELILVRHGETASNKKGTYCGWTDVELNEEGIKQAQEVQKKLAGLQVDSIYSSPLKRASKTAEIINENFKLEIMYSDNLKERNFGVWDNLDYGEIAGRFPEEHSLWVKDWVNYCMQDGESAYQQYKRVAQFTEELTSSHESGTFVIVTHHGCIRIILAYLLGMKVEDTWHFKVGNGSITRIEIVHGYPVLTLLNG
ncbi:MAG: alpha-ribazole phosphatase [Clostridiales bacterium]|nr:alpha-ribazole phosphatase [Eubacteriales bacterium]MDH7565543.1 alpha-ribazole phosphatase [Clostridiales bacterium]